MSRGARTLRRWVVSATVALLGHVGLFTALEAVRTSASLPSSPEPLQPAEIALEVEGVTPVTSAGEPPSGVAPPLPLPTAAGRPHPAATGTGSALALRETREPAAAEPAPVGSVGDEGWSFAPTKPVDITAPGALAQSARDVANQDADKAGAGAAVGGLSDALDQRDVSLGLGRGGPVLSALETASRGMDVPIEGAATFDVAIDTSGHVSVALSDVTSEYAAWSKVAGAAGAAVDAKRVRIPPGARGWHVVVRIDAKVQYPNGLKPKQLGNHFEASPGQISKTSMVMDKLPGFTISTRGKVCGVGLSVTILGPSIAGGCDPENAGMPAGRVVSGHIVSEGRL